VTDSTHVHADSISRHLCDLVFEAARAGFPDINRLEKKTWCTFAQSGRSNGFDVRHGSRTITVWLRWDFGNAEDLQKAASDVGLKTGTRRSVEDTKRYPIPIKLLRDADVDAVKPVLLYAVSQIVTADSGRAYRGLRIAQEVPVHATYPEGSKYRIVVNAYERKPAARLACIMHYGTRCVVCNFDFGERYGEIGEGFIHVHHMIPLSSVGPDYQINPKQDLRPVCPNCHETLHRRHPPYSIEELKRILQDRVV
jgi:predicted HNH restriction endonuclease